MTETQKAEIEHLALALYNSGRDFFLSDYATSEGDRDKYDEFDPQPRADLDRIYAILDGVK